VSVRRVVDVGRQTCDYDYADKSGGPAPGFQDGQDVHHHALGHDSGHGVNVRSTTPLLVMATVGLGAVVSSSSDVTPLAARLEARIKGERATVALYAKNLRTARDVGVGPDRPVRTASHIEPPIRCALESL